MSTPTTAVGHNTTLSFGYEDTFGGGVGSGDRFPFGLNATLSTLEGSHNQTRGHEPGSRDASQINAQQFEGSVTAEFQITNPHFLGAVIAAASGASWSGEQPQSIAVVAGAQGSVERVLTGAFVNSMTISFAENDPVDVSLDITYTDETKSTTIQSQPAVEHQAMFWHNTETLRAGEKIGHMTEIEISLEQNAEAKWDEGSRHAATWTAYNRDITFDYTNLYFDDSNLERFYGGSGDSPGSTINNDADATVSVDNGTESIDFDLVGNVPTTHTQDGVGDVEADLTEGLEEFAKSISASCSGYGLSAA